MNEELEHLQYEEELVDIYGLPIKELILKDEFETNRKIFEEGFRNVIISLEKTDPITIFIDSENKPFFNITKIMADRGGPDNSLFVDENGLVSVDCDTLKIKEVYCPICGNRNYKFDNLIISDLYTTPIESNKYFNKKTVNGKSFKYINCDSCLDEISDFAKQNPKKKIKNPLLYDMYIKLAKAIGLEEIKNNNDRILFPNDICSFSYKNQIIKLNLFNLGSIVKKSFDKFVDINNIDEISATMYLDKILTKHSYNLFDDNDPDFKIYRDFEAYLLENSEFIIQNLIDKFYKNEKLEDIQMPKEELKQKNELEQNNNQEEPSSSIEELETEKSDDVNIIKSEEMLLQETVSSSDSNTNIDNETETDTLPFLGQQIVDFSTPEEESVEEKDEIRELTEEDKQEIVEIMNEADKESKNELTEAYKKLIDNTKLEISEEENEIIGIINKNSDVLLNDSIQETEEIPTFELSQEQKDNLNNKIIENESIDEIFVQSEKEIADFLSNNDSVDIISQISSNDDTETAPISIEDIKDKILFKNYPEKTEIESLKNELKSENKPFDLDSIIELFIERKAQYLYHFYKSDPKFLLKEYEFDYTDLQNYIYLIEDKRKQDNDVNNTETKAKLVIDGFNPNDVKNDTPFGVEDEEHYNYIKQKQNELEKEKLKKKNKFSEIVFHTPNFKQTTPFEREKSLIDSFNKSVFKRVFDEATKACEYKCGKMVVTINEYSNFAPIVDFPDVGIRFVCIDTSDFVSKVYEWNPVRISYRVPFANPQYKTSYSMNILYSNECATRQTQVSNHISKLIGWKFADSFYTVTLSDGKYPIAYTTEPNALSDFEAEHSIFATETSRVKNSQITLVAFVPHDKESVTYKKRHGGHHQHYTNNGFNDLLNNSDSYYVASAHYTIQRLWADDGNGNKSMYMYYCITQYTENMHSIILDGLPAIVSGIIKEHNKHFKDQNTGYAITFENDITQLYSPSIRLLLSNNINSGVFEIDPASFGQPEDDTVTSYIINEDRFKMVPTRHRNDNCRTDYRIFQSNEDTFRKFMYGKIDDKYPIDDRHKVLMQLGYKPYPEPRPLKYAITNKALDQLEMSPLFKNMFEIKISQINDISNQENYNNILRDMSIQRMINEQNANMEPGARIVKAACDIVFGLFNKNKQ